MKLEYEINAVITAQFTKNTVLTLLQEGALLNIRYFDLIVGVHYSNAPLLSIDQATDKIMQDQEGIDNFHATYIKIEDTYCHLHFKALSTALTQVSLWGFSFPWEKSFMHNITHIDLARYSKVLLKLTKNFNIIKFDIYGD